MLGKDVDRNCDVERSNHYKVTLRFIKDANNVDWHISYTPENPEISVPSPMYISYLHGEKLDIPVVVRGARVLNFKAQIIENNWFYEGHPAIHTDNNLIYNGFLSFVKPDVNGNMKVQTPKSRHSRLHLRKESRSITIQYLSGPVIFSRVRAFQETMHISIRNAQPRLNLLLS